MPGVEPGDGWLKDTSNNQLNFTIASAPAPALVASVASRQGGIVETFYHFFTSSVHAPHC